MKLTTLWIGSPGKCKVFILWLGRPLNTLLHTSV